MRALTGSLSLGLVSLFIAQAAPAAVVFVNKNVVGGTHSGTTWANAATTLDAGLGVFGSSLSYTEVWVAAGTCVPTDSTTPVTFGRNVKLLGGFTGTETLASQADPAANVTIITGDLSNNDPNYSDNANQLLMIIASPVNSDTVVDGFTFKNARNLYFTPGGAGLILSRAIVTGSLDKAVVSRCKFVNNGGLRIRTQLGAAISSLGNSLRVVDCQFDNNFADPTNDGNTDIAGGAAVYAVGKGTGGDPQEIEIANCHFTGNYAFSEQSCGGAVYTTADIVATIANCDFVGNYTSLESGGSETIGGAVYLENSNNASLIANCKFTGNSGIDSGGSGAKGGAIAIEKGNVEIDQCTIAGNDADIGGGIYIRDTVGSAAATIKNCIIWDNTSNDSSALDKQYRAGTGGSFSTTYSDVAGISSGTGNINLTPAFINAGGGHYRLKGMSPCIELGNQAARPNDNGDVDEDNVQAESHPLDLDATSRVQYVQMDMGAYEYVASCLGDLDADGDVDAVDLCTLSGQWSGTGGADLDCSGSVGAADLGILLGAWGSCGSFSVGGGEEGPTPWGLAASLSLENVEELADYLGSLDFKDMQTLLAAYFGM
ncbi:MAG: hypothetical protein SGJ09_14100 [Phycisphaerae bacterium]|nr:hypothetical protein [Phycisphaerae bacterium]